MTHKDTAKKRRF